MRLCHATHHGMACQRLAGHAGSHDYVWRNHAGVATENQPQAPHVADTTFGAQP